MAKYIYRYLPKHPKASASGCVYAHIAIAEAAIGRLLPSGAEVHHVNGNGHDNRSGNLVICQDKAYHKLLHVRARIKAFGGNPNTDAVCSSCQRPKPKSAFAAAKSNIALGIQKRCRACCAAADKGRNRWTPKGKQS